MATALVLAVMRSKSALFRQRWNIKIQPVLELLLEILVHEKKLEKAVILGDSL
jgi:hypothetical protein